MKLVQWKNISGMQVMSLLHLVLLKKMKEAEGTPEEENILRQIKPQKPDPWQFRSQAGSRFFKL